MRALNIATGPSRLSKDWRNQQITWQALTDKLKDTKRTTETEAEYKAMTKEQRGEAKDVGGFVGGSLKGPQRKRKNLDQRSLVTLDADNLKNANEMESLWDTVTLIFGYAAVMYTTHSHTTDKPRIRLVLPMTRDTNPDEYVAISRYTAEMFGIDLFDSTTHDPVRMMYWPSTPADGEYIYRENKGAAIDVDEILKAHPEWTNLASLPKASQEQDLVSKPDEAEDPTDKRGPVGEFCRTYDIHEAIAKFIPDIYTTVDNDSERYTYAHGSTAAGLQVFDNGLKAHSHHMTDPAAGQHNAFDLVRIHKFGDLDDDVKPKTPINKMPSFIAMKELVDKDPEVKKLKQAELNDLFTSAAELVDPETGELKEDVVVDPKDMFFDGSRFIATRLRDWFSMVRPHIRIHDDLYIYDGKRYVPGEDLYNRMSARVLGEYSHSRHILEGYRQLLYAAEEISVQDAADTGHRLIVENGIVDIRTGEVAPHTPDFKKIVKLPVAYDPHAECPAIEEFLDFVTPGQKDLIYEMVGYCLSPTMKFEKAFFFYGHKGSNGKGTLLQLIEALVGRENTAHVSLQMLSENRFAPAELFGRMININTDIPNEILRDPSMVKALISGDPVRGEKKNRDPFSFPNRAKMLFSANELPNSHDNSGGFHRRWIVVPFDRHFNNRNLRARLFEDRELSGLLNKAIEGLRRLEKNGRFSETEATLQMAKEYRRKSDSAYGFIEDTCQQGEVGKDRITKTEVYQNYQSWCRDHGNRPVSQSNFNSRLMSILQVKEYRAEVRYWDGLVHKYDYLCN